MKPWVIAVLAVGVLVLSGLPVLAVALASDDDAGRERASHGQGREHRADAPGARRDKAGKADKGRKTGKAHKDEARKRELRAQGPGAAWRNLTPAQRAKKMAELSRIHADGMQKWADCVAAGKDDCVRPLPPGLAKRR